MRISIKTTFLSLFALCFCFIGYSQSNGNLLVTQLLNEEKVSTVDKTDLQRVNKAMEILDDRKESGKISESVFQNQLNDVMVYRNELRDDVITTKLVNSENNRKAYLDKKEKGEVKDIFDMSKDRLKVKLEKGTISQSQYDDKVKKLNARQAARKVK